MKKALYSALLTVFALSFVRSFGGTLEVYFSPNGGATEAIVREIGTARSEITVQMYSFTSFPIARALVEAQGRGVAVKILSDKDNVQHPSAAWSYLTRAIGAIRIDYLPDIAHSKDMVIDRHDFITGSFNFTKAAETNNVENVLIGHDFPEIASQYIANFNERMDLSKPLAVN